MADDLTDQIASDARKSQSITADGVTITRRSLQDQIAADRYLRDVNATDPCNVGDVLRGMTVKLVPPGGH